MTKRNPAKAQKTAPKARGRRKSPGDAALSLHATRLTSTRGIANEGKLNEVLRVFDRVCALKNAMSAYCHTNLQALFVDAYAFQARYKEFHSPDLNAWERQTLFQDLIKFYQTSLKRRFQNMALGVQTKMVIERYVRNTRTARAGDVKHFRIERRSSPLTSALKYLLHVEDFARFDPSGIKNEVVRDNLARLKAGPHWARLTALAAAKRARLIGKVRLIHFSTGSHRRHPKESDSHVTFDATNGKYQYFYRFRIGTGAARRYIHLPLLFNARRCTPAMLRQDAVHVCYVRRGKFMAGMTYEAPAPSFKPEDQWLGLDANTKHNLFAASDGRAWSYDRLEIGCLIALLEKTLAGGTQAMSYRQKARWAKLCRQNEGRIQRLISELLDTFEVEGITDLCLEDLDVRNDMTFLEHQGLKVKYSRLLRLLRLSNLKAWMMRQAEKRGIRVHLTNPAYTSQECPHCHHADRANRTTQETFICTNCGLTAPADTVAAHNTKERVRGVLGPRLHAHDEHGRATPKPMRRDALKSLVINQPASALTGLGGFTELSTPSMTTRPLPSRKNKPGQAGLSH